MSAPDTTTPNTDVKKTVSPRPYLVTSKVSIDLSQDPSTIVAALEALSLGEQTVDIFVVAGTPESTSPKKAVEVLGEAKELQGSFDVIAANAVTNFPNVTASTKRVVSVG